MSTPREETATSKLNPFEFSEILEVVLSVRKLDMRYIESQQILNPGLSRESKYLFCTNVNTELGKIA